jgi:hypothetical protein
LVQNLPTKTVQYRYADNSTVPGWPDFTVHQPATKSVGSQITESEEHSGWRQRLKDADSKQDVGGDFFTQKRYLEGFPTIVDNATEWQYVTAGIYMQTLIQGPMWSIDARLHQFPPSLNSTADQLDELGATAVARCRPTNSAANVGVAIGELVREGVPKLAVETWQRRAKRPKEIPKGASEEYLAYQFGLAPLGQEIGNFAAQVIQADRLLAQYERDAGRVVRRRYEFPTKQSEELLEIDAGYPAYMGGPETGSTNPSLSYSDLCKVKILRSVTQRRWFSGAFTYFLPPWYDARNEMSRKALLAKEILGLDLDAEVLWNLTPWSWAIDWFTNAGDVISNANSVIEDGLIMRYGYMMEHTIVRDTYIRSYPRQNRYGVGVSSAVTLVTETKLRRRANPFGFGLTWEGLDDFQLSILAALGISRNKRWQG